MTFPMSSAPECARAWELMPWALQDSAPAAQKEWLMAHLARCEACSTEFAQQARLRVALSLPTDVPLDADAGLARLMKRLDAPASGSFPERQGSSGWLLKGLAAAVLIQAIGIGVLGTRLLSDAQAPYRTLSAAAVAAPVPADAIRVVPDPAMKMADWNQLLHGLGLRVTGGPNSVGAYTVVPVDPASAAAHPLQQLRTSAGIRLAEPVDNSQ